MTRWVFVLGLLLAASPAQAAYRRSPFDQGSLRLTLNSAFGVGADRDYLVVGAGVGYFVIDGLELALDIERYFGREPTITTVSPQLTYVFYQVRMVPPYLGLFYRRAFYDDDGRTPDLNTAGVRAGGTFFAGQGLMITAGAVYERVIDKCSGDGCDALYPELAIAVAL
jgi:hypothetical protein